MKIDWASLGLVAVVALAVSVAVVALVSFALVGLSARARANAVGGPDDGAERSVSGTSIDTEPPMSPAVGTAVSGVCLLAVAAIVVYGLYVIVA